MLQTIRDRASGWIAYAVIILISIPFALWGVNHYLNGAGKQVAAQVGGTSISAQTFAQAYQGEQMRLQQMFGGQLPAGLDSQTVKQMVLRQLVRDAVFHQAAASAGYRVTDKELLGQLAQYPAFRVGGKFSKTRYLQILQAQGMTAGQFEGRLRRALTINQLQSGIQQTAFATGAQTSELLSLRDEQRDVSFVVIPAARYAQTVKVDTQALQAYYDKHKTAYMTAEMVRLAYLRLDAAALEKGVKVTAAELQSYFQAHQALFRQPERAQAREIVVDLTGAQGQIDARLKSIAAGLSKGESFATLAQRYSQAASAKQGGSLGEVTPADLPHALANALFALKPGQVTPPIRVGQKVYRLKLEAMQMPHTPSFGAVRDQVRSAYLKSVAERQFNAEAQRLATLAYGNPGSLAPAAKALGLQVQTSGWLTRSGGPGLGANAAVLKAAFSTSVLSNGSNSQPLDVGKQDVVVVRVLEHKVPAQKPFEMVRADIRSVLMKQAADKAAEQAGKVLVAELKSGKTLAAAAQASKFAVHAPGWIGRTGGTGVPAAVTTAAFQLSASSVPKSGVGSVRLANGDYAVFDVKGIKRSTPAAKAVATAQTQLGTLFGQVELQVAYQALERAASVKVYPNNLN